MLLLCCDDCWRYLYGLKLSLQDLLLTAVSFPRTMSHRRGSIAFVLCGKIVIVIALLLALPAYDAVELRACLRSQAQTIDGDSKADSDKSTSDDGSAILALEEELAEESNRRAGTGSRRVAPAPQPFKLEHLKLQWDSWTTSQVPRPHSRMPQKNLAHASAEKGVVEEFLCCMCPSSFVFAHQRVLAPDDLLVPERNMSCRW